MSVLSSNISKWLQVEDKDEERVYKTQFAEHHLGNIYIRSLHGGVSASFMELCAEAETKKQLDTDADVMVIASSTDYLRITKDADLYARTNIVRLSRRLSVVDVVCWQDSEDVPVVRATVTIKITA